jgi:hypothetical protein
MINTSEFRIIKLPDDPRLTPAATRKRQVKSSKAWRRARFTPRAINGRHANHPLTHVIDHADIVVPKGW